MMRISSTVMAALSNANSDPRSTGGEPGQFTTPAFSQQATPTNRAFSPRPSAVSSTKRTNQRASGSSRAPVDYLQTKLNILASKQLAFEEGIQLLEQAQRENASAKNAATFWGNVAVYSNAIVIPLNIIVNAFELKKANGLLRILYQTTVKTVYEKYGASGTRAGGPTMAILKALKTAVTKELESRGLTDYVPGVAIIFGLAEDFKRTVHNS